MLIGPETNGKMYLNIPMLSWKTQNDMTNALTNPTGPFIIVNRSFLIRNDQILCHISDSVNSISIKSTIFLSDDTTNERKLIQYNEKTTEFRMNLIKKTYLER